MSLRRLCSRTNCSALTSLLPVSANVSAEQLVREHKRRRDIGGETINLFKLLFSSFVREGMSKADALSLERDTAKAVKADIGAMTDFSSKKPVWQMNNEQKLIFKKMLCHVRKGSRDCDSQWSMFAKGGAGVISGLSASLLQMFSEEGTEQSIEESTQTQGQVAKSSFAGKTDNI